MSGHAILSPSSAYRWLSAGCTGSPALNYAPGEVDEGSVYADEGTAAHALLEWCLVNGKDAREFPFPVIHVSGDGEAWYDRSEGRSSRNAFDCDEDMREHIQTVVDDINRYAKGNEILAEQRVHFAHTLGVPAEFGSGTADARVRDFDEGVLQVHDLKYGASPRGIVYAGTEDDPNPQLMLYGVGALEEEELLHDWEYLELHIHQPRLDHKDVLRIHVDKVRAWVQSARAAAAESLQSFRHDEGVLLKDQRGNLIPRSMEVLHEEGRLQPSDKGCHYCKRAHDCLALRAKNANTIEDFFEDVELPAEQKTATLAAVSKPFPVMADLALLETFVEAVKGKVRSELKAGRDVPGWKMVKGRRGARAWVKEKIDEVEKYLKEKARLKVDEMYTKKVISPTAAEKLLKDDKPKHWAAVTEYVHQPEGNETLADESDKRPAIKYDNVDDLFE